MILNFTIEDIKNNNHILNNTKNTLYHLERNLEDNNELVLKNDINDKFSDNLTEIFKERKYIEESIVNDKPGSFETKNKNAFVRKIDILNENIMSSRLSKNLLSKKKSEEIRSYDNSNKYLCIDNISYKFTTIDEYGRKVYNIEYIIDILERIDNVNKLCYIVGNLLNEKKVISKLNIFLN